MSNNINILTYKRNSSNAQTTSQTIQSDVMEIHFGEEWFRRLIGGIPVVSQSYDDAGKSGSRESVKRDGFDNMLDDLAGVHKGKPIIIMNLSRFARLKPAKVQGIIDGFRKTGTTIVSIDDRKLYSPHNDMDMLEIFVRSKAYHDEARSLAAGMLRGKLRNFEEGRENSPQRRMAWRG